MAYNHRVQKWGHPPVKPALPRDAWRGATFIEADGTVCEVVASGRMPTPAWPQGMTDMSDVPARLHLKARAPRNGS